MEKEQLTKKQKVTALILVLLTVALAVLGYFLLPDMVNTQIRMDGEPGNAIPKLAAIAIPVVISAMGIGLYLSTATRKIKYILLAVTGDLLALFFIILNNWILK